MKNHSIIEEFEFKGRKYFITYERSQSEEDESLQLSEQVIVRGKPLKYLCKSDGILLKSEPIAFACRNMINTEIEISMQYEGLPIEPMQKFINSIQNMWQKSDLKNQIKKI